MTPETTPQKRRIRRSPKPEHQPDLDTRSLINHEDPEAFANLRRCAIDRYDTRHPYDEFLAGVLASNLWRARRTAALEAAALDTEISEQLETVERDFDHIDDDCRTALAFKNESFAKLFHLIHRTESAYLRRVAAAQTALRRK